MKHNFKDIARSKQALYFKNKYGIEEFASIKRKLKDHAEPVEFYVEALLKLDDAKDGKIFYEGYRKQILYEINKLRKNKLYTPSGMMMRHTLRSEHIPWNVFFPMTLSEEKNNHAKNFFNKVIGMVSSKLTKIKKIVAVRIEYAPNDEQASTESFTKCYLNDRTSFDTYIEYIAEDGEKGGIGIEVKYTEEGYLPGETEKKAAITDYQNPQYRYLEVMKNSAYYTEASFKPDDKHPILWSPLVSNELRQIWRNHLLGASMVQHRDISHFLSLHLYPQGNIHFHGNRNHIGAVEYYRQWLSTEGKKTWMAITFEVFFQLMQENFTDQEETNWIKYLKDRYLF